MKYLDALKNWLSSEDGQAMNNTIYRRNDVGLSKISPSSLPSRYDNAEFDGAYVRKGKFANTVKEYKDMYE